MSRKLGAALLLLLAAASSCGEPSSTPTAGSNSNWLVSCELDAHCSGATSCVCTRCTRSCETDADCAGLGDVRCALPADAAGASECGDTTSLGLCLPRCEAGGCDGGQACVAGACVLDPAPSGPFCGAVSSAEPSARVREDELLALVQEMRETGGVTCGTAAPSEPVPTLLRHRGSLRCAARVLAVDVDAGTNRQLVDASGRDTGDRLAASGYPDALWAEGYVVNATTASDALAVMLADETSCAILTSDGFTDVGVGSVGRATVVTLAAE